MNNVLTAYPAEMESELKIENEDTRSQINHLLTLALADCCLTPYIALEKVRKVLMPFHISIPKYNFLEGNDGADVFDVNQFGETKDLFIYFEYAMNDLGEFDVFCEIVDEDELDELASPDTVDVPDDALGFDDHHDINHAEHSGLQEASISKLATYIVKAEKDSDEGKKKHKRNKGMKLAKRKFAKALHGKGKVVAGTLNEVSKERLKQYISAAKDDKKFQEKRTTHYRQKALDAIQRKKITNSVVADQSADYHAKKVANRKKGIAKAQSKLDEMTQDRLKNYVKKAQADYASSASKAGADMVDGKDTSSSLSRMSKRLKGIRAANKRGGEDHGI